MERSGTKQHLVVAASYSTVCESFTVVYSPGTHSVLPSTGEVLRRAVRPPLVTITRVLSTGTPPAANSFLQSAGKKEQLVVATGIGMHLCQEHPPHMFILEKRGSISAPCLCQEKTPLPSFSLILGLVMRPCKAHYRASATRSRTHTAVPPYVASRRSTSRGYRAMVRKPPPPVS